MLMERDVAARLGREAVAIVDDGGYVAPSGKRVDLRADVARAVAGTVTFPPETDVAFPARGPASRTTYTVVNRTTLEACREWAAAGKRAAALNFASATSPGGGFLTGARAQEETLARSSGLYACLRDNPMYPFSQAQHNALYSHYVIYSPDVPVFRTDDGTLLESPYPVTFITAAAPNAKRLERAARARIPGVLTERLHKVLAVAAQCGHDTLILGAWGCGAFGNDPAMVAPLFGAALRGPFAGVFAHVEFAILDLSDEQRFIGPFRDEFVA